MAFTLETKVKYNFLDKLFYTLLSVWLLGIVTAMVVGYFKFEGARIVAGASMAAGGMMFATNLANGIVNERMRGCSGHLILKIDSSASIWIFDILANLTVSILCFIVVFRIIFDGDYQVLGR